MKKSEPLVKLVNIDTYVFIDASNIRAACLKTLGLKIDFCKFLNYLKHKYINLKEVRYYEGASNNDIKKRRRFRQLELAAVLL